MILGKLYVAVTKRKTTIVIAIGSQSYFLFRLYHYHMLNCQLVKKATMSVNKVSAFVLQETRTYHVKSRKTTAASYELSGECSLNLIWFQ